MDCERSAWNSMIGNIVTQLKKNSLSVEMILQYTKTTDLLKVNVKSMLSYTLCFIVIV